MSETVVPQAGSPGLRLSSARGRWVVTTTVLGSGMAALVYLVPAIVTRPHELPSAEVILSLLALGAICTAAAFVVFFALIAEVGPARATVITYVNPAVAVALGVGVLGEHLTPAIGIAFVAILGGSILATRPSEPKRLQGPRGPAESTAPPPVQNDSVL